MKTVYRRTIGIGIIFVIFYFIGKVFYREGGKISEYNWSPHLFWLIFSILILSVVYLMAAYGWILIIRMLEVKIRCDKGLSIFFLSLFGRYIPGGVWTAMGRIYLSNREGIPDSRSSIGLLLEQSYHIVSAGLIFAMSLFFWNDTYAATRILPFVIVLPLFAIFLHPWPFLKILNPVLSRLGRMPVNISLSFRKMLILTVYYSIYWMVTGSAFYLFVHSFYPLELYYLPVLTGIYAVSFAAGYLAFFTPAGLGVREGSLSILLSLFIPLPVAIGIALLSRLWMFGVEMFILSIFLINAETRKMVRTALGW